MDSAIAAEGERLFGRALAALKEGETPAALAHLERALKLKDDPSWYSLLGYLVAKERGQVKKGLELCGRSLEVEPHNPVHFLNLAKIHLVCGSKEDALVALRKGMTLGGNEELAATLSRIGSRKPPIFSRLPRNHPLNKYLGLICDRLRLR